MKPPQPEDGEVRCEAGEIELSERKPAPIFELLLPEAMVANDPPKFEDTWVPVYGVRHEEEGDPGHVIFELDDDVTWLCGMDFEVLTRAFL